MPEYKRFIAYFYEYIDGRKQKNAGFAKVELRNGMWRILFRIRPDQIPESPVQVFGFVRERGYLLGFLLGNMNSGYEIAEEWAYGAEKEIGHEKYRFGNLAGIWIQSGDGQKFITVWDDDPVDVQKFVLKIPGEKADMQSERGESKSVSENAEQIEGQAERQAEGQAEGQAERQAERQAEQTDVGMRNIETAESIEGDEMPGKLQEQSVKKSVEKTEEQPIEKNAEKIGGQLAEKNAEKTEEQPTEKNTEKIVEQSMDKEKYETEPWLADLFRKRRHVQPFADGQIHDCIQIMPCDLMRFQQKGWQVGRSSFLQHGFYQYHHLLLGRNADGEYVLGVPGIRNTQDQYMAQLFGYDKFLKSKVYDCGRVFGYWCRKLQENCS